MKPRYLLVILVVLLLASTFPIVYNFFKGLSPVILPTSQIQLPQTPSNSTGLPLTLPPGFSISYYATDLTDPRVLAWDPTSKLLVSSPGQGEVITLPDKHVVVSGFRKPHGLAISGTNIYIANENSVVIIDPQGMKTKILDLPSGGNHVTRSLLIKDNQLYTSIGSTCNACLESDPKRGAVYVSNLDGTNFRPFATGLRNSVFMLTNPSTGEIWATEMGQDLLGNDLPPDELNILRLGQNYGWPDCYGANLPNCSSPKFTPSHIDFPAHSAPLGFAFIPDSWPKHYRGNLLVAFHGSWNRNPPTGYKIIMVKLDKFGRSQGQSDFISGWLTPDGSALGRPVGLLFDSKGNLYISDDKRGVIYKVKPPVPIP